MELSVGLESGHALYRESRRAARSPARAERRHTGRRLFAGAMWSAFSMLLAVMLAYGWINRNERHWVPETGFGYWLGIAGAVGMLALLIYPLRKRFRSLRFLGPIPLWFRLHMALGLLGPSLILLHCNFKTLSLNASVALYAMLIVAGSGLVGRFLYARVHSTLSGKKRAASTFFDQSASGSGLSRRNPHFSLSERSLARVSALTKSALVPQRGLISAIGHAWLVRWQTRQMARVISRELRARSAELNRAKAAPRRRLRQCQREFEGDVANHLSAVRKAAGLAIHERLFALWHFLHLPLFLMLVVAVIVHIIAVHLY